MRIYNELINIKQEKDLCGWNYFIFDRI